MKRITFEVEDDFHKDFEKFCIGRSKKKVITELIKDAMSKKPKGEYSKDYKNEYLEIIANKQLNTLEEILYLLQSAQNYDGSLKI